GSSGSSAAGAAGSGLVVSIDIAILMPAPDWDVLQTRNLLFPTPTTNYYYYGAGRGSRDNRRLGVSGEQNRRMGMGESPLNAESFIQLDTRASKKLAGFGVLSPLVYPSQGRQ
ncbi:hypothetical protein V496_02067, partial [Pseudogymnoascus sp. VKM F-4515 (FW-2607)]